MTAHTYEVETVSTRETPAGSRTAHWSETVTAFQGAHAYGYPSPEGFHARATRQRTPRFQLVTWHIEQEQTISRTRAQIRAGIEEEYRLLFPLAGSADLRTDGVLRRHPPHRRPGRAVRPRRAVRAAAPAGQPRARRDVAAHRDRRPGRLRGAGGTTTCRSTTAPAACSR